VLPDNSTTTYQYQGNTVTVTDAAGKWKTFTVDAFGNLVTVLEPDPVLQTNVTTSYTYDVLNHLIGVSMPRGGTPQTRTFNYNLPSPNSTTVTAFLQSATNPENGTVNYTYSNGLLFSKTDAKGQQLTYQYDSYNRLSTVTWANNPLGSQVLRTYTYDTDSTGFSQNALGRLTAVQYAGLGLFFPHAPPIQLVDRYSYTAPGVPGGGLPAAKRLQVNQTLYWQANTATATVPPEPTTWIPPTLTTTRARLPP